MTDSKADSCRHFFRSGSQLIAEQFPDGTERIYLNGGLSPIGFVQEGQSYFVHEDHHGLAHEIVDENNITQWQASFDSFGNVTSQPIEAITYNQRFPGQYADVESGLYYNYYRDYDPQAGRYLQSDPIGLAGGLNTYGYVGGNPIGFVDLLGLRKIGQPGVPDNDGLSRSAGRSGWFACFGGCFSYVEGDNEVQASISLTVGVAAMVCSPNPPEEDRSCSAEVEQKDCGMYDPNCDNSVDLSLTGGKKGVGAGFQINPDGTTCVLVGPFIALPVPINVNLGDVDE